VANDQDGEQPIKCHLQDRAQIDRGNRFGVVA
jgi:hypothetical protein